ncbi:MAG: 4-hydroxy-tetrahydrodipicolinate synthase [Kiritimatiellae bacterium]|nr:4-hydroxy-tetrahydrodipicolinate synthase [Kiritimatiellia bacterium]
MIFEGAYTALVTPFAKDGKVDYGRLAALVEEQIAGGVAGLVPVGTSGESPTLSHEEHIDVIRAVVETVHGRVQVIAGAGSNSTAEALHLTKGAIEAGADATLQVAPYYNRPTQSMLVSHFTAIADLGKPVVLYNIPGRTGVEIAIPTVAELAKHPMIQCVKEAGGSVDRVSKTLQACDIAVLSGDDSLTLPMMSVGAKGVVSVVTNVAPQPIVELVRAALEGRYADALALHRRWYPLMTALFLETNPVPVKAALEMTGRGEALYRSPLGSMSAPNAEKLRAVLAMLGLLP